jgi:hypothetical protein
MDVIGFFKLEVALAAIDHQDAANPTFEVKSVESGATTYGIGDATVDALIDRGINPARHQRLVREIATVATQLISIRQSN